MPLIPCEVSPGLRASERTVKVRDYQGTPHNLRVEAGMIATRDGRDYLPVGAIGHGIAYMLVELPHEADSGVSRLWVPDADCMHDWREMMPLPPGSGGVAEGRG